MENSPQDSNNSSLSGEVRIDGYTIQELIVNTRRAKEEWRERQRALPFEEKLRILEGMI